MSSLAGQSCGHSMHVWLPSSLCTLHHCARSILGTTRSQQWEEHTSLDSVFKQARLRPRPEIVSTWRLQWLGHLARMEDNRIPKRLLFGELLKTRPCYGTPKRWHDNEANDLKGCNLSDWYGVAQKWPDWKTVYNTIQSSTSEDAPTPLVCRCGRVFRGCQDLTRHS